MQLDELRQDTYKLICVGPSFSTSNEVHNLKWLLDISKLGLSVNKYYTTLFRFVCGLAVDSKSLVYLLLHPNCSRVCQRGLHQPPWDWDRYYLHDPLPSKGNKCTPYGWRCRGAPSPKSLSCGSWCPPGRWPWTADEWSRSVEGRRTARRDSCRSRRRSDGGLSRRGSKPCRRSRASWVDVWGVSPEAAGRGNGSLRCTRRDGGEERCHSGGSLSEKKSWRWRGEGRTQLMEGTTPLLTGHWTSDRSLETGRAVMKLSYLIGKGSASGSH